MIDGFDRNINYLRISVTDLCNLRCSYCMPEEGVKKFSHEQILSVEEIETVVKCAVQLGVHKIRLTGGEPLVRKGIVEICKKISAIDEIDELCITTNGLLLGEYATSLKDAGVTRFNISLDTLNDEKYRKITRCAINNPIDTIVSGIKKAETMGFSNFKINVVLMGGINDDEINDFIELTKENDITVRFIELMPIGPAISWNKEIFISNSVVLEKDNRLKEIGISGVSHLYQIPGYTGKIGLISPVSNHFCSQCNRLRVTSDGKVKACLHSGAEGSVKGLSEEEILHNMREQIKNKPKGYDIGVDNPSSAERTMNQIGG